MEPLQELKISEVSGTGHFFINASQEFRNTAFINKFFDEAPERKSEVFSLSIVYQDSTDQEAEEIKFTWKVKDVTN